MDNAQFIRFADRASIAYAAVFALTLIAATAAADGLTVGARGVVGGDFLAFYTAGDFALRGEAATAYDFAAFDGALKERAPIEQVGMMWQYPPAMFFLVAPFALLPYKVAYIAWIAAGWSALGWSLAKIGFRDQTMRLLLFSSLSVSVFTFGQLSTLTAGLLFLAAFNPKARWLTAGVAAGLLTLKPQLGLLLPFAFLAIGAWRTIGVACVTALCLHALTFFVFGAESWSAFIDAVFRFKTEIAGAATMTPPRGMTTVFGQLKLMGLSGEAAMAVQFAASAALAALTVVIFRKPVEPLAKAAFLGAAAILAAPYAYGYEMTTLLLAGAFLANRAGAAFTPLGGALIAGWLFIAARPFIGELAMLNTAFAITAGAFAAVVCALFSHGAIDRTPAHA